MFTGDDQQMTVGQRTYIEKGKNSISFVNNGGRDSPRNNLAENATGIMAH